MSLAAAPLPAMLHLREHELGRFLSSERAALILTSRASLYSQPLCRDVERLVSFGRFPGVTVGILPIESPAAQAFRRDNPWIEDDQTYPYIVLYRDGLRVEGFSACSASYLLDRLERLAFIPHAAQDAHAINGLIAA